MKTIGLIGGMSWKSTITYYEIINNTIKEILGGLHSAKILLYSVDFAQIEEYQRNDDWDKIADILSNVAKNLEMAGADFLVICANTTHKITPKIQSKINIPIIHIAEATADYLISCGIKKVALLGTIYTLNHDFYINKLLEKNLDVLIPDSEDIKKINSIIYDELCLGVIKDNSREFYIDVIQKLKDKGAEAVILGCTEIGLLISQDNSPLPVFDTTEIHAKIAVKKSLQ